MKSYRVGVTLYVEDDDADGALATAQTILEDAGGSDVVPRAGDSTFGFGLGSATEGHESESATVAGSAVYVLDARGYDIPELYRFADEDAAVAFCRATGRYNDSDGIEPDVHILGLSEASA